MLGAICGDILGSTVEFNEEKYDDISKIKLCLPTDDFTDDTALTMAVADWLLNNIEKEKSDEDLKLALAKQFVKYSLHTFTGDQGFLSFGMGYMQWCHKADLIKEYAPYNSYGNGSGMRVSPIGWFFDTLEETLHFAKLSADVTHNHSEGEKGAMAIAASIYLARNGKSKQEIRDYIFKTFNYGLVLKSVKEHRDSCCWSSICQDTVPMAIVAFLESDDYESAVRNAISYGSDSDTIACMAGAIAEAYYREIPVRIKAFCLSRIPHKQRELIEKFYDKISPSLN